MQIVGMRVGGEIWDGHGPALRIVCGESVSLWMNGGACGGIGVAHAHCVTNPDIRVIARKEVGELHYNIADARRDPTPVGYS